MGTPFLGEIRLVSFNFAPKGWAQCNGQLLPINQNQALFSLLGTTYGGNGLVTFALPDFRGRAPMHVGASHVLGESAGSTSATLAAQHMPAHSHVLASSGSPSSGSGNSVSNDPANRFPSRATTALYADEVGAATNLRADSLASAGGSQPHNNMQPYSVLTFVIALQGLFPTQN